MIIRDDHIYTCDSCHYSFLPTNSQSVVLTAKRQQLGWIPKSKLKITIVFVLKSKLRLKL